MAEIVQFIVVPFDFTGDDIVAGDPIKCTGPVAAIQQAKDLWKTFGHAGAIALSHTSDFEIGMLDNRRVLRRFGQVPNGYS
jgi:hypothetical protein